MNLNIYKNSKHPRNVNKPDEYGISEKELLARAKEKTISLKELKNLCF